MAAEIQRVHVFISGRVQGVGYRAHTRKTAVRLGLKGWVRNLSDGRVEAVFEGDRAPIEQMLQWCHQGPPFAAVKQVQVSPETPEGLESFQIQP